MEELICTPLTEERCQDLKLGKMVSDNTDPMIQHLRFQSI